MEIINPSILLLGSKFDLSCDYVIAKLHELNCGYLRLNSEDLEEIKLKLDPIECILYIYTSNICYRIDENKLKTVYYRRPVFLREYDSNTSSSIEKFTRYQWSAFIRNLMIFSKSLWINHPRATYFAEHKAIQLNIARKVGFHVPKTIITNQESLLDSRLVREGKIICKGLDTVLLRTKNSETFGYTNIMSRKDLINEEIKTAPVIFQEPILNKTDIRVTVIGSEVFSVKIQPKKGNFQGDWRIHKNEISYLPFQLPQPIIDKCLRLMKEFGLVFGAIDFVVENDIYYFLEINPTGEWAWLVDSSQLPIDFAIAKCLSTVDQ